ncbi:MAG TPA: thiamine-phosphate kinase [Pyrinomonadaceae bacterium]|nr:thiamine-phosphate kinase [Pyrinomonadaceae bacterium]
MNDDEQREAGLTATVSRSEFDLIRSIREQASKQAPSQSVGANLSTLLRGIGDDGAVIKQQAGRETVISTDLLVEDVDFRRDTTTPQLLGHKALSVSLSDNAAMGARPRWALLSLAVPQQIWDSDFIDQFYEGFFDLAHRYDVRLVGGDVSRAADKLTIDSILLGECGANQSVFRSGAQPGDLLFVTGSLGGAAGGLRLIERGARLGQEHTTEPEWKLVQELLHRQLSPEPRVGWGVVLGEERLASAMIDISDGLSSDLNHLCGESKVGALVQADKLPVATPVTELCGRRALDPLMLALHGGEDFELLFTVNPQNVSKLPVKVDGVSVTCIGEIKKAEAGIRISEGSRVWELKAEGWQHFGAH